MTPQISVIIPSRNEAEALGRTLEHLTGPVGVHAAEIVVTASGDPDRTEQAVGGRAPIVWPVASVLLGGQYLSLADYVTATRPTDGATAAGAR